jgi:hypothetical protein
MAGSRKVNYEVWVPRAIPAESTRSTAGGPRQDAPVHIRQYAERGIFIWDFEGRILEANDSLAGDLTTTLPPDPAPGSWCNVFRQLP